mmetsp:Transcript_20044/g.32889  ORF Transcript_20044/g.32889 Transcript_20044/m.32889 type:complete len:322 (+) Transcript_20044:640-1605(+)
MQQSGEENLQITNAGFQFLLKDIYTQVWTFMLEYVGTSELRSTNRDEVLAFLFQLSFLVLGKDYAVDDLSPTQRTLLPDLREFGLVFQHRGNDRRFYPTRLAINLSSGMKSSSNSGGQNNSPSLSLSAASTMLLPGTSGSAVSHQGFIIVESNYKVYAYTSSPIQLALLSLFVRMQIRLPNVATGVVTRESVRAALMNGITATQMIDFLTEHAHPVTKTISRQPGFQAEDSSAKKYVLAVPETVCDQIRLWESERNRVTYQPGVLYDQFPNMGIFKQVEQYARENGVLLWSDKSGASMRMVVELAAHESMRAYIKKSTSGS